jgi:CelD/BcsL family acetyltransferase involved in cellulose biosynthesis
VIPFLDAWRELANGAPMRSPEWLLAWWEIYAAPNDELWLLLFHETEGVLVGLAPLYLQDAGGKATFRLLGSGNDCTHHPTWLSATEWENQVGLEVAQFLLRCKPEWNRLLFEAVDADAAAIHATMNHLAANGCLCHERQINSCWKIVLPASWEDYLMMLSRSLRKRCRKLQKQFLDSGKIQIRHVENEEDLQKGFAILLQLHGVRWGSAKKPLGVFNDRKFRMFHERVAGNLLDLKKLRLTWLECDGKPIAVEYQFVDAKAVYAYQAGVDLTMDAYSPGKLSMMAAIQYAIAHDCEFFDLLRGDDPYKANWRASPVACHDLRAWQNRAGGRAEWAMWNMYTHAAQRLKSILPPRVINLGLKLFCSLKEICSPRGRGYS